MAISDSTASPATEFTKICSKCGECKPATAEFYTPRPKGFLAGCRPCMIAYQCAQRIKHADARRKAQREKYADNRESILERQKKQIKFSKPKPPTPRQLGALARRLFAEGVGYCFDCGCAFDSDSAQVYTRTCVVCTQVANRERYAKNKEALIDYSRQWRKENKDLKRESDRSYRSKTREARNKRDREKVASTPSLRIRNNIRVRIFKALARFGLAKDSCTEEILGCSLDEFQQHMERQFLKGMSWENRGRWHIDHIIPLVTAQTEEEVIRLNHFTNLRPLWAKDNLEKSDQILFLI